MKEYNHIWRVTKGNYTIDVKADCVNVNSSGDLIFMSDKGYLINSEAAGEWKTCTIVSLITGGTDHVVTHL